MGFEMRVFLDRWMAVTLILLSLSSRWPLLPPLSLDGHLDVALLFPGPHPVIFTMSIHTHLFSLTDPQTVFHDSQSLPAPGD